ncbi:MAG: hypothetical protein HWE16_09420 [Gammaproteobacteria bacterium]|nr:hypothetical protein [Gammaproteobacteria bacterium]
MKYIVLTVLISTLLLASCANKIKQSEPVLIYFANINETGNKQDFYITNDQIKDFIASEKIYGIDYFAVQANKELLTKWWGLVNENLKFHLHTPEDYKTEQAYQEHKNELKTAYNKLNHAFNYNKNLLNTIRNYCKAAEKIHFYNDNPFNNIVNSLNNSDYDYLSWLFYWKLRPLNQTYIQECGYGGWEQAKKEL